MGQGWSQEYSTADIYTNPGATTSAGIGPRISRADSEPPTSAHYGGTKLNANIPEDEELKTTPSELAQLATPIASADWKRASAESGILKEKPATLAALLESKAAKSSTFSDASSLEQKATLSPPKPRDRAQSVGGYSHFADFSLFPDKFGVSQYKKRHPSSGSNLSDDEKSIPTTPPPTPNITTPLQSVTNAFFRARASSYDPEKVASTENVIKSPSLAVGLGSVNGEKNENKTDKEGSQAIRPRSASYGSGRKYARHKGVHADRQPFADYTLFPDKDPKVDTNISKLQIEKGQDIQEKPQIKEVELPSKKFQSTLTTVSGQPPTVIITEDNINYVNSAVLIASALTMEANKKSRYDNKPKILPQEQNINNNTGKHAQTRFSFFDYSMIPDKDPRSFVLNNKQKPQHDDVFVKDQK